MAVDKFIFAKVNNGTLFFCLVRTTLRILTFYSSGAWCETMEIDALLQPKCNQSTNAFGTFYQIK